MTDIVAAFRAMSRRVNNGPEESTARWFVQGPEHAQFGAVEDHLARIIDVAPAAGGGYELETRTFELDSPLLPLPDLSRIAHGRAPPPMLSRPNPLARPVLPARSTNNWLPTVGPQVEIVEEPVIEVLQPIVITTDSDRSPPPSENKVESKEPPYVASEPAPVPTVETDTDKERRLAVTVTKTKPRGQNSGSRSATFYPASEKNPIIKKAWRHFEDKTEPHNQPREIKPKTPPPSDENARIYRVDMKDLDDDSRSKSFTTHNGLSNPFHHEVTDLVDTTLDAKVHNNQ